MSRHSNSQTTGDRIFSAARNNPEGLMLLAAGAALVLRRGSSSTTRANTSGQDWDSRDEYGNPPGAGQGAGEWRGSAGLSQAADSERPYAGQYADTARQYASDVRQYAADVGNRVADTASAYASSTADYANEAGRATMEKSGQFVSQVQSALQDTGRRLLQDQPLLVALAGLAAGAAVAAALPRTDIEERTLGPAGEQLTEYATQTAEQLKTAGMKAGEQLMSSAQQRGLSPDGLKEMAHEAADEFGTSFSGSGSTGASAQAPHWTGAGSAAGGGSFPSSDGSGYPGGSPSAGSQDSSRKPTPALLNRSETRDA